MNLSFARALENCRSPDSSVRKKKRNHVKGRNACRVALTLRKRKKAELFVRPFKKDLAATYSRGSYTTTTIGNAAFDGRVRDGNGSDHSFMATKKNILE